MAGLAFNHWTSASIQRWEQALHAHARLGGGAWQGTTFPTPARTGPWQPPQHSPLPSLVYIF